MSPVSQATLVGGVAASIVVIFAIINGVPWASKDEVNTIRTELATVRAELTARNERLSAGEVRLQGHDLTLAELKSAIVSINGKLDTIIQQRR